jgi:hypothetical protein
MTGGRLQSTEATMSVSLKSMNADARTEELKQREEDCIQQKQQWLENARHPVRVSEIDERNFHEPLPLSA